MPTSYEFTLPLPPPLNHTYVGGNMRYKTTEAKNWQLAAQWKMKAEKRSSEPLQTALEASVTLHLKRDRDIDSSLKLLFDSMQAVGIYKNDSQIRVLHVCKVKDKDNPRLEVALYTMD